MDFAVYERPQLPAGTVVADLSRSVSDGPVKEPKADERVTCINRGRNALTCTYDSMHKVIPAGLFEIEYEAAKHFRDRLIVPGTKNVEANAFVSWIGILGVDHADKCQPFTDAQLLSFGEKVEAIDRSSMSLPSDREIQIARVQNVQASSLTFSNSGAKTPTKGGIDASVQATPAAAEAAERVLEKPGITESQRAEAEAAREGVAPPAARRR
jgi:hypothetical protein